MKTVVIGTAGHIDHGKSALVKALTGTDPDRLKEEQERGITIDLGFAHVALGDAQLAFVDVPGHERFVRNMLAGAGGIDAVLLVVAATESVMPQTREHFDICRLLGIERGVIALTKIDIADDAAIARARADIGELVAGSTLEDAPVVPVSARSGAGLDDLRQAVAQLAGTAPRQHRAGVTRLPIDRVFTVKGFGVVVTGTLVSGVITAGETLVVLPEGRRVRVRGVQVHGHSTDRASAPQRVAVNLAGVDLADLHRGMTLTSPGSLAVTTRADVRLHVLPGATPLRHGARVRVHHGASEVFARVSIAAMRRNATEPWIAARPGEAGIEVVSGGEAHARLRFERLTSLTRGDRFVIRRSSPAVTIGGGEVIDPEPERAGVRRASTHSRLLRLAESTAAAVVLLEEGGTRGLDAAELVRRAGFDPAGAERTLQTLAQAEGTIQIGARVFSAASVHQVEATLQQELAQFHSAEPMEAGVPRARLKERAGLRVSDYLFDAVVSRLSSRGVIAGGDRIALATHRSPVSSEDERVQGLVESCLRDGGLTPPEASALAASLGTTDAAVAQAVQMLVREKRVVRIGTLVFHRDPLERLRADVAALRAGQPAGVRVTLDVAVFKTRYGLTRKHAIPLLEWLDRERVTRRVGDLRVVL